MKIKSFSLGIIFSGLFIAVGVLGVAPKFARANSCTQTLPYNTTISGSNLTFQWGPFAEDVYGYSMVVKYTPTRATLAAQENTYPFPTNGTYAATMPIQSGPQGVNDYVAYLTVQYKSGTCDHVIPFSPPSGWGFSVQPADLSLSLDSGNGPNGLIGTFTAYNTSNGNIDVSTANTQLAYSSGGLSYLFPASVFPQTCTIAPGSSCIFTIRASFVDADGKALPIGSTLAGTIQFQMTLSGYGLNLGSTLNYIHYTRTVSCAGQSGNVTLARNPIYINQTTQASVPGWTNLTYSASGGPATVDSSTGLVSSGNRGGNTTISAVGTAPNGATNCPVTNSAVLNVPDPDFSISISPTTRTVTAAGQTASYTLTLSSQNNFSGFVDLAKTVACPTNIVCVISPTPVFLSGGGAVSAVLEATVLSGSINGTYDMNARGTSGSQSHSTAGAELIVNLPAAINGQCGTANNKQYPFGTTGYGSDTQCIAGTSSNTAFPAPGATAAWTCQGINGGTNISCSASQATQPSAGDFYLSIAPLSIFLNSASQINTPQNYLVTAYSRDGFSGNVALSLNDGPSGKHCPTNATCAFQDSVLHLSSGGSDSTNLIITPGSGGFINESYLFYAAGASGSLTANISASWGVSVPPTPPPPTGVGSGTGQCQSINITWDASSGADGYYIYRNTTGQAPDATERIATLNSPSSLNYTDTPAAGTYYYFLSAYNASGQSSPAPLTNNPLGSVACNGSVIANKDIIKINGSVPPGYSPNDLSLNESPVGATYFLDDAVTFSLNIINPANSSSTAANLLIKDALTNLKRPAGGWDLKINSAVLTEDPNTACGNPGALAVNHFVVCGSEPYQYLYVKIGNIDPGQISKLTFAAKISVPVGFKGASSRFQNAASFTYTQSSLNGRGSANTPSIIFYLSRETEKREVAP